MPVDRGAIDAQLKEIGESERWWEQREFRDLPNVLNGDERIRGLVTGRLLGPPWARLLPAGRWLMVATDQRLICMQQERFGRKQVELRAGQITGIHHRSGIRAYQITLETLHRTYRIRIPKADAFRFIRALTPLIPAAAVRPREVELAAPQWPHAPLAPVPERPALPPKVAAEPVPRGEFARLQADVDRLEGEVERLKQQVEFMEKLLHGREGAAAALPRPSAGA